MSVEMTPELENLVESILDAGGYRNENEVLSEALRLLQQRDSLRAGINKGIDELDRVERIDGEVVFAELRTRATDRMSV